MGTFIQMNRLTKTYRQLNNWINKYFFQISFSHLESEFLSNGQLLVICHYLEVKFTVFFFFSFFFLPAFSFTDTDDSQDSRGKEKNILYSTQQHPPSHEHSDIYLQLSMWDDYHIFLIASLVFTTLLLDEICLFIELPFEVPIDNVILIFACLLDALILGFCYSNLTPETSGLELASNSHRHPCITSKPPNNISF